MAKITYLFGAGASYGAVPIVEQIPAAFDEVISRLSASEMQLENFNSFKLKSNHIDDTSKFEYQNMLIEDLIWLKNESASHASIDTFAKKLSIKNDHENLTRLKITLSTFFSIIQTINPINSRYDAFFASILESVDAFPENIRILSWNYDNQLELAYSNFTNDSNINTISDRLKMFSKNNSRIKLKQDKFTIVKLNGTASLMHGQGFIESSFLPRKYKIFDKVAFENILSNYAAAKCFTNEYFPALSFSWEPEYFGKNLFETIKTVASDTSVLVVIGYSFPFFNRSIDRKILELMPNLNKVYIQDPNAIGIKDRIKAVIGDKVVPISPIVDDMKLFYFPNEL